MGFIINAVQYGIVVVLYALVGALVLQLTTRIACNFRLRYGKAYPLAVILGALTASIHWLINMGIPPSASVHPSLVLAISTAITFLAGGFICGNMIISRYTGDNIGPAKGFLVAIPYYLCQGVIGAILLFAVQAARSF